MICIERQILVSMLEQRQLYPGTEIPLLGECQRYSEIVNLEQIRQGLAEDRRDRKKPTTCGGVSGYARLNLEGRVHERYNATMPMCC